MAPCSPPCAAHPATHCRGLRARLPAAGLAGRCRASRRSPPDPTVILLQPHQPGLPNGPRAPDVTLEVLLKEKQAAHAGAVRQLSVPVGWCFRLRLSVAGSREAGAWVRRMRWRDALSSGADAGLSTALPIRTQPRRRPELVPRSRGNRGRRGRAGLLACFFFGWLIPQVCILRPWEASARHRWVPGRLRARLLPSSPCLRGPAPHLSAATGPRANDHGEARDIPEVFPSRLRSLSPYKR